jgi:hypothetical protein
VQSHYRVNLGVLSTGYIVPDGLDDDGAEAEINCVDALAAPTPTSSPMTSWRSFSPRLLLPAASSPESG